MREFVSQLLMSIVDCQRYSVERFPGQYFDEENRLYYNHFRYYGPELGRYITSDPIGLSAGPNTFSYVLNNPLRYTDTDGLVIPSDLVVACQGVGCRGVHTFDPDGERGIRLEVQANAALGRFGTIESNLTTGEVQLELIRLAPAVGGGFSFCIVGTSKSTCPLFNLGRLDKSLEGFDSVIVGPRTTGISIESNGDFCINVGASIDSPIDFTRQIQ